MQLQVGHTDKQKKCELHSNWSLAAWLMDEFEFVMQISTAHEWRSADDDVVSRSRQLPADLHVFSVPQIPIYPDPHPHHHYIPLTSGAWSGPKTLSPCPFSRPYSDIINMKLFLLKIAWCPRPGLSRIGMCVAYKLHSAGILMTAFGN